MAESLATLSPAVLWKVENITNELSDPVEEISSQNTDFFLLLGVEGKGREKIKEEMCNMSLELESLENSQLLCVLKN